MSLYSVLDDVMDSNNFTVGGGSASAIAGSMAAGLISMVSRLSIGKDYGLEDRRYEEISKELDQLCKDLASGSEEDTQAFLGIKSAFSLPKDSDDQKALRRKAIEDAAVVAATVPMENADRAKRVLDIYREMDGKSNPNASSDFTAGMLLAKSAILGCALNIDANLSLIKDEAKLSFLKEASDRLKSIVE